MDKIKELIEFGYECDYLDFKEKQYHKDKSMDLIMDVMAMANSRYNEDKFIIIGIKDRPEGKELKGIDPTEFIDSSNYTQLILNNLEPEVQFDYFKYEYKDKVFGIFRIYETVNKPYMMRKKFNKLNEGYCLIRKGSTNSIARREDFDYMYLKKGHFEIRFLEQCLYALNDLKGYASIQVLLSNNTDSPITLIRGTLYIYDNYKTELSKHPVYGVNEDLGADFIVQLSPKSEIVGCLNVGFGSSDPLKLNIDEYGTSENKFIFELILIDARNNEYSAIINESGVIVKGDFLWKVKYQKGIAHKF